MNGILLFCYGYFISYVRGQKLIYGAHYSKSVKELMFGDIFIFTGNCYIS